MPRLIRGDLSRDPRFLTPGLFDSLRSGIAIILFFIFLGVPAFCQQVARAHFRASIVKVDITPAGPQMLGGYASRESTGTLHKIYHRIVAMHDGHTEFFLISTEVGKISPFQYEKLTARLKAELGIDPVNVWWSVTHTHSAPEVGPPGISAVFLPERYRHPLPNTYTALAEQSIVDGITEARKKLEPARIGWGLGFSQANINRRAIDVDGKASLGLNPDGPTDRMIGLLRLEKEDGGLLALVANYPIHGTVLGQQNLLVSGDAPGVVAQYVEENTAAPMLFINGAAGDLAPIYSVYPDARQGHLNQFRVLLGDKILTANKAISTTTNEVILTSKKLVVQTPRKDMGWPEELKNFSATDAAGKNFILLPIQFLKINEEVVIWSAPLELFCNVARTVRADSPFAYTFYFGYTNGNLGYLPTRGAWEEGGYETTVSPFTPSAEDDVKEAVIGYLHGELRAPSSGANETTAATVPANKN